MTKAIGKRDYFISYTRDDHAHAHTIADALKADGRTVFIHEEDLKPGGHFPSWMDDAITDANQMICLFSPEYFDDRAEFSAAERYAAWRRDPLGKHRRIVPVMVRDCQPPPLFDGLTRIDVTALSAPEAGPYVAKALRAPAEEDRRLALQQAAALPAIQNIPRHRLTHFVGRGPALDQLHRQLDQGSNVAVTAINGMGGIGKTTLAAEYAHRFGTQGRYGGVWWINAETPIGLSLGFATLAPKLGLPEQQDQIAQARSALDWLANATQPWLIVLDNLPDPSALRGVAAGGEKFSWRPAGLCRVLITSRYPKFGADAHDLPLDQWDGDTATNYLLTQTDREDEPGARALAHDLGGLPLAVDQAASYLAPRKDISFALYAERLADMLARTPDPEDAGDNEKPVYAALVLGLEDLHQDAQDLLCLLSWLSPDGCDLKLLTDTAEKHPAFTPDPLGASLRDPIQRADMTKAASAAALIRVEGQGDATTLITHRITQTVLRRWQHDQGRQDWDIYATGLVRAVFPTESPSDTPSIWPLCHSLLPHALALADHGPCQGEPAKWLGYVLAQAGLYLADARGDTHGAIALMEPSVALTLKTEGEQSENYTASLSNLSDEYTNAGRYDEAEQGFLRVLEIERETLSRSHPKIGIRLNNLGRVYWAQQRFAQAEPHLQRALEIRRYNHGEASYQMASGLNALGALYDNWAEQPGQAYRRAQAQDLKEKALATARAARGERHPDVAAYLHNLAILFARLDDFTQAADQARRAAAINLSLGMAEHPLTQRRLADLNLFLTHAGQEVPPEEMEDFLHPKILEVEDEMHAWVAEDPDTRHFGPPSFFADKPELLEALCKAAETADP